MLCAGYESQKSKAFLNHQKLSYPKGVIESWLSENFFFGSWQEHNQKLRVSLNVINQISPSGEFQSCLHNPYGSGAIITSSFLTSSGIIVLCEKYGNGIKYYQI